MHLSNRIQSGHTETMAVHTETMAAHKSSSYGCEETGSPGTVAQRYNASGNFGGATLTWRRYFDTAALL